MGMILSLFRRTPLGTKERLEKIRDEIREIEDYKWSTLKKQKHLIGLLMFSSVFLYIIVALVFYFYYLPRSPNLSQKLIYSLPLFIFPFIVWGLKQALSFYYRWVIDSKEDRLKELKKEKEKILEKIMETETYKVAIKILEEFDPSRLKKEEQARAPNNRHSLAIGEVPPEGLRRRFQSSLPPNNPLAHRVASQPNITGRQSLGAARPMMIPPQRALTPGQPGMPPMMPPIMRFPNGPPPRQLARPILPSDRGIFEKLVDYVVGDGPSNRYALICKRCYSHNGMALKEDYEYLSFNCCYCGFFNPARKQRAIAPQLPPPPSKPPSEISETSDIDDPKPKPEKSPEAAEPTESGSERQGDTAKESDDESISASEEGSKNPIPLSDTISEEIAENHDDTLPENENCDAQNESQDNL